MVDKTGDAIALWQQMVGDMQKSFAAVTKQALGSSSAPRPPGEQGSAMQGTQKQITELMENYFAGMNLPSRGQLNDMTQRLRAIELELSEIKALMLQMANPAKPKPPTPRPRVRRSGGQSAGSESGA